jgi:Uma2 family endonuclease
VFFAPLDMILSNHDVCVPDIVVALDSSQISPRAIEGPADLVVEVLSPSNRAYDRGIKKRRYLELGVRHHWIVDPDARHLLCLRAGNSEYVVAADGRDAVSVTDPAWPELVIDLASLWR